MKRQKNKTEDIISTENTDLEARHCALLLLFSVLDKKTPLDQVLEASKEFANLPIRERNFCRMLLTTTLRHLGQIDDLIHFVQDRPDNLKTPQITHILRLGVTQLFFMDVPDHAAVDTSVRLCEKLGADRQKGFVNAILRNLIRRGRERLAQQNVGKLNTPVWLFEYWERDYGLEIANKIANANMNEAPLDITLKYGENPSYWSEKLESEPMPTGTLRKNSGGNIRDLEGFDTGCWWVQDISASLPAKIFGNMNIHGKIVADLCAAPGGKTLQLVSLGARVIALDRSATRIKKLEENLHRMHYENQVDIVIADAAQWNPPFLLDYILLDAPCSATGTIRRHPDTGYLKSPQDVKRLSELQARLLDHALDILAPNGTLIYCTCSLQKDEGEYQIQALLNKRNDIKRTPITSEDIGGLPEIITVDGDVRALPNHLGIHGGMDGFFISRLQKH